MSEFMALVRLYLEMLHYFSVLFLAPARPYLETFYYLSILILAVVGIKGLRQISLMKSDIESRRHREAIKDAMALIDRFNMNSVELINKHDGQMEKDNVPRFKGKTGDFSSIGTFDVNKAILRMDKCEHLPKLLNELEVIAAGVNSSRPVTENLVFSVFGKTFCEVVEENYDVITLLGYEEVFQGITHIADLYKRWHARIHRLKVERKRNKISAKLDKIIDEKRKAIGTDLK